MKHDRAYFEAQRIFNRCCHLLQINQFSDVDRERAKNIALLIADEVLRSSVCRCEYYEENKTEKQFYIDIKYELTKL